MSQNTLYGGETRKAIDNFPISGEPVPISVIHWLARIKGAAAAVNAELGLLRPALARRIEKARRTRSPAVPTTTSSRSTSSRPARAPRRT